MQAQGKERWSVLVDDEGKTLGATPIYIDTGLPQQAAEWMRAKHASIDENISILLNENALRVVIPSHILTGQP